MRDAKSVLVLTSASVAVGLACAAAPSAGTTRSRKSETVVRVAHGTESLEYRVDCAAEQECSVAWLTVDCCGSQRALGVRASAARSLEARIQRLVPRASCECLASPTRLDDGQSTEAPGDVRVSCRSGRCVTEL